MAKENKTKENIIMAFQQVENGTALIVDEINDILTNILHEKAIAPQALTPLVKSGFLRKVEEKRKVKNGKKTQYILIAATEEEAVKNIPYIFNEGDISSWPAFEDVKRVLGEDSFIHIGTIIPNPQKEELIWQPINEKYNSMLGLVYHFVIDGHSYKNGKTDKTMAERISSYNCGKKNNRNNGTCSVTNFYVLQSILNIKKPVEVYVEFPGTALYVYKGQTYEINVSPSRFVESMQNKLLEEAGINLPGCVQQ